MSNLRLRPADLGIEAVTVTRLMPAGNIGPKAGGQPRTIAISLPRVRFLERNPSDDDAPPSRRKNRP
jgi:hypothetical protein